jgi:TrkA domain protein
MLRSPSSSAVSMNIPQIRLDGARTEAVTLTKDSPILGKTFGELDLRGQTGATVIAVVDNRGDTKISPGAGYKLREGDTIVVLGSAKKLARAMTILEPEGTIGGFNP